MSNDLLNKTVVVTYGPFKGHVFVATTFEQGLYWSETDEEPIGFRPDALKKAGVVQTFTHWLLS